MNSFESAYTEIQNLVNKFKQGEKHYLSPSYNETEVRKDFIDKFFIALGWDVNHDSQPDPYQQEVKVEKTQDNQKRTDYTFFLSPNFKDPKFFVEAKKPSQHLHSADYYFQTIRYGWNSKTPVAVLTDFEEFHILDCRIRPDINKVLDGYHKQYSYTDYSDKEKFSEIFYLFSHDSVADGSLECYADSLPKPKGKATEKGITKKIYQTIDEEFLEYIDRIRESLAKAFKKNDENLGSEELTEATQRTIDRLVFIRFLEDKLIEQDNYVNEFGKSYKAWTDFITVCRRLDSKYNGIVFKKHFIDEQNFRGPELNEFRNICNEISHQNTPYDFNAIPIHILGSIYERFLGKVVHATDKRVKVEEKPEVRKAGGVYYTPKYIVDYIVENTIGKILRNETNDNVGRSGILPDDSLEDRPTRNKHKAKSPAEISKLRFADIACGSGSFLIGAFECLLDYHKKYYQQHKSQALKDGCIEKDGIMVLSIKQKQNILLNNIYGVDIDQQAVEVTQLSLALKMLEDETTATANDMQVLFKEKILPDLSRNIICGNSLIGTDILSGSMFASDEERKLNPMDFETTFPHIFPNLPPTFVIPAKAGIQKESVGFDAIIGNPPYVLLNKELFNNYALDYLLKYEVANYKVDLFHLFLQRAIDLIKIKGHLGYIVPNQWLTLQYSFKLRKYILDSAIINRLVIFNQRVFAKADVYSSIIISEKNYSNKSHLVEILNPVKANSISDIVEAKSEHFDQMEWYKNKDFKFETRIIGEEGALILKIINACVKLDNIARASLGCQAYNSIKHTKEQIEKRVFHADSKLSSEYLPELAGNDVSRYSMNKLKGKWIKYGPWLHDYRTMDWLEGPRLLVREIPSQPPYQIQAYYTEETYCNYKTILNINPRIETKISMKYLCGLVNSRLISFIYPFISNKIVAKSFPRISVGDLRNIPVIDINFSDKKEVTAHDKIVSLVDQMLESKKQLQLSKTDKDKTYYERKCDALDKQIDSEVYNLYGLTEEEIKIVEGKENE